MSKKAYTPNWIDLWSRKIDYLEYYINNKDNLKSEIKGILYYFIGLGENAIKYIKDSLKTSGFNQNKIVLSHYRVDSDSTLYSLYNPFNLMLDYSVRDIAEYIKSMFYSDKIDYIEIENLVNKIYYQKWNINYYLEDYYFLPSFLICLINMKTINWITKN